MTYYYNKSIALHFWNEDRQIYTFFPNNYLSVTFEPVFLREDLLCKYQNTALVLFEMSWDDHNTI